MTSLSYTTTKSLPDAILLLKPVLCEHRAYANHFKRISAGNARARAAAKTAAQKPPPTALLRVSSPGFCSSVSHSSTNLCYRWIKSAVVQLATTAMCGVAPTTSPACPNVSFHILQRRRMGWTTRRKRQCWAPSLKSGSDLICDPFLFHKLLSHWLRNI